MNKRERGGLIPVLVWGVVGAPLVFGSVRNIALAALIFLAVLALLTWYYYFGD